MERCSRKQRPERATAGAASSRDSRRSTRRTLCWRGTIVRVRATTAAARLLDIFGVELTTQAPFDRTSVAETSNKDRFEVLSLER